MKKESGENDRMIQGMKMPDEKAREIAERFGVEDSGEEFLVKTHFKDGREVTHHILKWSVIPLRQKDGSFASVPVEDIIEAVREFYPTVEKGEDLNLEEAIEAVRAKRNNESA